MLFCPLFIQIQKISFIQIIALFRTVVEAKKYRESKNAFLQNHSQLQMLHYENTVIQEYVLWF